MEKASLHVSRPVDAGNMQYAYCSRHVAYYLIRNDAFVT